MRIENYVHLGRESARSADLTSGCSQNNLSDCIRIEFTFSHDELIDQKLIKN